MNNVVLNRDSNTGPLAPKARIIPLDYWATLNLKLYFYKVVIAINMQRIGDEGYSI